MVQVVALLLVCGWALGGCLMPTTCREQCYAQQRDCEDEAMDEGQQFVCANSAERCAAACPPDEL